MDIQDIKVEALDETEQETKHSRKLADDILNHFSVISNTNQKARIKSSIRILRHLFENKNGNKVR